MKEDAAFRAELKSMIDEVLEMIEEVE